MTVTTNGLNDEREDSLHEGRDEFFMDIDRMVNEGLGGGIVSPHNGLIEDTTTDTMDGETEAEPADDGETPR